MAERPQVLHISNWPGDLPADAARIAHRHHTTLRDVVIAAVQESVGKRLARDVPRYSNKYAL